MNWVRMHDGSYHAVKVCFGTTYSYVVRRTYAGRGEKSSLWAAYVNDRFIPNDRSPEGCTFCGAKERAAMHHGRVSAEALRAHAAVN